MLADRRLRGCQTLSALKSVDAITMFIDGTRRSKAFYEQVA
jgi:hypothetical protein